MKTKKKKAGTAAGREIIAALTDIAETLEAGIPLHEKYRTHKVTIAEPGAYGPKEVKSLRTRLGLSQSLFAQLIGASTILVQKWEGGDRRPDGMARRLMDDIGADPEQFLRRIIHDAGVAGAA
jgi:putative transcriptional regulator